MFLPLFLIPILTGLLAQLLKLLLNRNTYGPLLIPGHKLPRYGGMPSAHSAFAASLATTVSFIEGMNSASFAIAAALLFIILDDALRMRMLLGRYGQALHMLVAKLPPSERRQFPYVESRLGHTLPEVLAGALFGVVITGILFWLW